MTIDVTTAGLVADGFTDNTAKWNSLIANSPEGSELFFPCSSGNAYVFSGQINFASNHAYTSNAADNGTACALVSNYSGSGAAFNFVGVQHVDLRNLHLRAANSAAPPPAIVMLGGTTSARNGSYYNFDHVSISGYASMAAIYTINSEVQNWTFPNVYLAGGGAKYVFYTSDQDSLGICPACYTQGMSNTDIRIHNPNFVQYAAGPNSAVLYVGGNATGDVSVVNGYFACPDGQSGSQAAIIAPIGALQGNITIHDVRAEYCQNFAQISAAASSGWGYGLHIYDNTLSALTTQPGYFINSTVDLFNSRFSGNQFFPAMRTVSDSFTGLTNCQITEPFPVNVANSTASTIQDGTRTRISSILNVHPGLTPTPGECTEANRGDMVFWSDGTRDHLRFCTAQAGQFLWQPVF